ncbi:hypothetical protein F442_11751 [Phytophthora nicotianae P10297]|uniref:Uncharacterized protein n=2 Tax=Phytophthora nicotianae TaxID=4792 RepID=W2Q029_PHYN3|nr:hypothetical protein PPTG_23317 [Phytophthora nicotianae INRA-310]ETN06563.1 hypothetical protein PPTG_23317 [Phytophthora nicotianae INRA-310]ETP40989.1 hypothetical protein F442_11751 [Phytophthora nicotianae P10297]
MLRATECGFETRKRELRDEAEQVTVCYDDPTGKLLPLETWRNVSGSGSARLLPTIASSWESIHNLFKSAHKKYEEHAKLVTDKRTTALRGMHDYYLFPELTRVDAILMYALEKYFVCSFKLQTDALHGLVQARQEQEQHDTKFRGFIVFDVSCVECFESALSDAQEEDKGVIDKQRLLWEVVKQTFPSETHCLFGNHALD